MDPSSAGLDSRLAATHCVVEEDGARPEVLAFQQAASRVGERQACTALLLLWSAYRGELLHRFRRGGLTLGRLGKSLSFNSAALRAPWKRRVVGREKAAKDMKVAIPASH